MCVLKKAAILAYKHIKETLDLHGYSPIRRTVGLWKHNTCPTKFCLYVDDSEIKYFSKPDAQHLLYVIGRTYSYTTDWDGKKTVVLQSIGIIQTAMLISKYQIMLTKISSHFNKIRKCLPNTPHILTFQYNTAQKNTRQYATAQYTSPHLPLQ